LYGVHLEPFATQRADDLLTAGRMTHAAEEISQHLHGQSRLWLRCVDRPPSPELVQSLATHAALRGLSRERLGFEIAQEALLRDPTNVKDCLKTLRRFGFAAAIQLECPARTQDLADLRELVDRAHAMGAVATAGNIAERSLVQQLSNLGVAAVSGPAIAAPMGLQVLTGFIGKPERWYAAMRAQSL
jgi:EAL domain-containing protein (putative c-di-GMP-specific phosphodiesterase class I)